MTHFEIGKVYTFNYESTSKKTTKATKLIQIKDETAKDLMEFIKLHTKDTFDRFKEQSELSLAIQNTADTNLQNQLKKEFREKFSSGEQSPKTKAQYLFYRNYNPTRIYESDKGKIKAVFAGLACTINGTVTYRWFVLSPVKVETKKLTDNLISFVDVLSN